MAEMKERFYRASKYTTLEMLELRCEGDEADLSFALTNLELGNQSDKDGTIGTYEETDEIDGLGFLVIDEYKNEAEANVIETNRGLQGHMHMFRGKAIIGDKNKKVTIFREKQP
ncbi:MAG: hypothetical protein ACKVRN_01355 [Pyrinomonadaceae bacterium]